MPARLRELELTLLEAPEDMSELAKAYLPAISTFVSEIVEDTRDIDDEGVTDGVREATRDFTCAYIFDTLEDTSVTREEVHAVAEEIAAHLFKVREEEPCSQPQN
jgi:hypothetical protein